MEKFKDNRGQIAITDETINVFQIFWRIKTKVSKSPNKTKSSGNDVIIYEKEYGYVYYLKEKRDNRKSLAFQTMYKCKKELIVPTGFLLIKPFPSRP